MTEASSSKARLVLWLACAWVAAGALFKFFTGSPSDLPDTIKDFPVLRPEWTFQLAIGIELSIVLLALARPRVGWVFLALLFVVFDLLLWQMLKDGADHCGCFGSRVPLKPWHMLAIDSVLLVLLLASRPWRAFRKRPLRLLLLVPLFAVLLAAPWFKFQDTQVIQVVDEQTGEVETKVVKGDWAQLHPAKWEGQVLSDTELAGFFVGGSDTAYNLPPASHVILYRNSCDHCRDHFQALMQDPIVDRPVILIRVPDDDGAEDLAGPFKPQGEMVFEAELEVLPRGYGLQTPVTFDLDGTWTVQGVEERPGEGGNEEGGK